MPERTLQRRRIRSAADVAEIESPEGPGRLLPSELILDCLRQVAAHTPEKPAILQVEAPDFLRPVHSRSYRQLVEDVEATANLFRAVAGDSASVVGLMLPMVPEGLSALWGAQTAGIGVPINPFLSLEPVAAILRSTRATALVTTREVLEGKGGVEALRASVPTLAEIFYVDDADQGTDLASRSAGHRGRLAFVPDPDPWRDALVMPTGGTTGAPKLVRMSQAGQLYVSWNVGGLMGNEPDTVTAHGMPNFHCGGTISLGLRTVLFGGTLLTLTREGFRSREVVDAFWDIARHYRVTSLLATPTTALALLHGSGSADGCAIRDFHVGGSTVPMELVRAFHDRFGIWLRENWGMTELHGTTTGHYNDGSEPRVGSVGRPLPFVRVKAVELDEDGCWVRDCSPGERGLLVTATPTAMAGYSEAELDGHFFPRGIPGELPTGARWANTGDIGTVDVDDYIWVFGRAKDLIIRGGHNIDPREIEEALASHPDVHLAAAVGRPDLAKGELPVAYVEPRAGIVPDIAELLERCRRDVHERAAVPVEVVVVDEMPLTPVGKVSKPALRADAVRRVGEQLARTFDPAATVRIDQSGPRLSVDVILTRPELEADVRDAFAGFEFATRVQVTEVVN